MIKVEEGEIVKTLYDENAKAGIPYDDDSRAVVARTFENLIKTKTSNDRPGMLLGNIQSGKTHTFLGVIALAADNGYEQFIVLTKGTKALTSQTYERLKQAYDTVIDLDDLRVFDIMAVPKLTAREQRLPLIIVAKKEKRNLERLKRLLFETYPAFAERKTLIIDDEADFASIGFKRSSNDLVELQAIMALIDDIRSTIKDCSFLQVTATPYSLYLQPAAVPTANGGEVKPTRPAFTELVPIHSAYVGGEYYFEASKEIGSVPYYLYEPVEPTELHVLHHPDRRRFKSDEALTSNGIPALRSAIVNFVVGGIIRRLQCKELIQKPKKYSFVIHTESSKGAHTWQEEVVEAIVDKLRSEAIHQSDTFIKLIQLGYDNIQLSIRAAGGWMPEFETVLAEVEEYLPAIQVEKVNSEKDIAQLLDRDGQLELRNKLNIFIGGQILDRGLTIRNLIGFYYGRRALRTQQDTVLQHHRMYGSRPPEDLAVTRFYTSRNIYEVLTRVHEFDAALRKAFEEGGHKSGVVFLQQDAANRIVPCSPNKILLSSLTTLRPRKRMLPVGFQTGYKSNIQKIIQDLDQEIAALVDKFEPALPVMIPVNKAVCLIRLIAKTFTEAPDSDYVWDQEAFIAAMEHISMSVASGDDHGKICLLSRRDRHIGRIRLDGRFEDAPDSGSMGMEYEKINTSTATLMLFRQQGDKESGWRGCPFWWPVLVMPKSMQTIVFAGKVDDYDEDEVPVI
jgi:hypothetical protein